MNQWGFPRKRNPYKEDEKLSAIIRDLWSKNYRSKEMLVILKNEHGYDLLPKQLNLIRKKKEIKYYLTKAYQIKCITITTNPNQ